MVYSIFAVLALVSLWVAAWLHWVFSGEIRQFLFAKVFPQAWRASYTPDEVLMEDDFETFLSVVSTAPLFVRGVLGCPGCLSAYISAAGTLIGVVVLFAMLVPPFVCIFVAPLIWAGSAWVGHRLYQHL